MYSTEREVRSPADAILQYLWIHDTGVVFKSFEICAFLIPLYVELTGNNVHCCVCSGMN